MEKTLYNLGMNCYSSHYKSRSHKNSAWYKTPLQNPKKNTKLNDKIGEMLAIYHRQRVCYLAYNHLLEIGKKKTPK